MRLLLCLLDTFQSPWATKPLFKKDNDTLSYHHIPIRRLLWKIKRQLVLTRMCSKGSLLRSWWESELVQPLWTVSRLLEKWKVEIPQGPPLPLLAVYPSEMKTLHWRGPCPPVFTEALGTKAKARKQLKWRVKSEYEVPHAHSRWRNTRTRWDVLQPSKEGRSSFCTNMDGTWEHSSEWIRPRRALEDVASASGRGSRPHQSGVTGGAESVGWGDGQARLKAQTCGLKMNQVLQISHPAWCGS